jgi:hypothetical protein
MRIRYNSEIQINKYELLCSISHFLKYKTPIRVIGKYRFRYRNRLRELILSHAIEYPFTLNKQIRSEINNAEIVYKWLLLEKDKE